MNVFGFLLGLVKRAFGYAKDNGLTDDLVELALKWVRVAAKQTVENPEKRELVVKILIGRGVPESVARIATELAYQLYKKEIGSKLDE